MFELFIYLFHFQVKSFNDALTKEVEHNLNTLYDGTFQTEIGQVIFVKMLCDIDNWDYFRTRLHIMS